VGVRGGLSPRGKNMRLRCLKTGNENIRPKSEEMKGDWKKLKRKYVVCTLHQIFLGLSKDEIRLKRKCVLLNMSFISLHSYI
jgi:hypothetical protein